MGEADVEFPLLSALGLYAHDIRGDGNCLFNALSDQLYGHQNEHAAIRSRVIDYMREHADYYKQFIDVHPGGGIRRNPKRKNAGAYSSPANFVPPSAADIDRVFESHLQSMARGGTYGDNMEITAFSSAYDYDVKIYQRDFAYMVSGSAGDERIRQVAHIAYHTWEHYSSIRNLDGPHTGLPGVSPKALTPEEERIQQEKLAQTPHVLPWMIDVVERSLPFLADKPTIKRAIEAAKGNIDNAVSNLLDAEENGSSSSHHESSSVERDHDSDDDMHDGPNKKQDRRMSRASRAQKGRSQESRHALSQLSTFDGSQESFTSLDSETSSQPDSSQNSTNSKPNVPSHIVDVAKKQDANDATSSSPNAPAPAVKPPVRLKLLPPRPPDPSQRAGKTQQRQNGPRVSARDKKDMKKQAQKAARKERQQAAAKDENRTESPSQVGLTLRAKGMTETPPLETLRTLYI
ncbi:cysteine protease [Lecanosticta acicola]|uniref:Cysteine protease n=1 Tax=Lecanosticta acicola TaxID=111012 RepID=A0AAI8Z0X2_9PEZI|nr:cysteine protease [Lecanosticta acicola]